VLVRRINNDGVTVWSTKIGDSHKTPNQKSYSIGFSIYEVYFSSVAKRFYYSNRILNLIIRILDFFTLVLDFGKKV